MIKVKTKIPSRSLTLLTKPNAAGECAVYLRYYLGSYIKKSTDIWVNQKDWDSKRQCVKSSAKNAARINARLYDIKAEIDKALLEYDGQITADVIRSIMTGDDKGEVPLLVSTRNGTDLCNASARYSGNTSECRQGNTGTIQFRLPSCSAYS